METALATRETITENVNEDRDGLEEVDYKVASFKAMVKAGQKAEELRTAEPIYELDENNKEILDKDGNPIPVYDAKGRETFTYTTGAPKWQIDEYTRQYNKYKSYLVARPHTLDRIQEEFSHATTPCDDYDEIASTTTKLTYNQFSATATTADRHHVKTNAEGVPVLSGEVGDEHRSLQYEDGSVAEYRFAYSTKDDHSADNVKVYEVSTTLADGTAVKFGAIEGGKLVNNGATKYTADSWNAYVDALGEVITSINAGEEISKTYAATTHLVMAENELEPSDEEPVGDTITVSGKVLIASDATGTASTFGLRGVTVYAVDGEGNVVAQTVSNAEGEKATWGEYSLDVPAGTTQLYVGSPTKDTIINRGFTISGDAAVASADVAVVMCDYNDDTSINVLDKAAFNNYLKNEYNIYADFNNDGAVNVLDKAAFNNLLKAGKANYSSLSF
jgi:hypothetical protein